eukprot:7467870-Pyramimonas_sp.AAC.1
MQNPSFHTQALLLASVLPACRVAQLQSMPAVVIPTQEPEDGGPLVGHPAPLVAVVFHVPMVADITEHRPHAKFAQDDIHGIQ